MISNFLLARAIKHTQFENEVVGERIIEMHYQFANGFVIKRQTALKLPQTVMKASLRTRKKNNKMLF